jgi:hypothetical protein
MAIDWCVVFQLQNLAGRPLKNSEEPTQVHDASNGCALPAHVSRPPPARCLPTAWRPYHRAPDNSYGARALFIYLFVQGDLLHMRSERQRAREKASAHEREDVCGSVCVCARTSARRRREPAAVQADLRHKLPTNSPLHATSHQPHTHPTSTSHPPHPFPPHTHTPRNIHNIHIPGADADTSHDGQGGERGSMRRVPHALERARTLECHARHLRLRVIPCLQPTPSALHPKPFTLNSRT